MTNSVKYIDMKFLEKCLPDPALIEVITKMREPQNSVEI